MSTRAILTTTLRWHLQKARRLYRLALGALARPGEPTPHAGVRWG